MFVLGEGYMQCINSLKGGGIYIRIFLNVYFYKCFPSMEISQTAVLSSFLSLQHPFPQSIYYERALPWATACIAVEYHILKPYLTSCTNVMGGWRMGS